MIRLSGSVPDFMNTEVVLTPAGDAVLDGKANFIVLNGIEDQVGGVRLSSKEGRLWLYDGSTLIPGDDLLPRMNA